MKFKHLLQPTNLVKIFGKNNLFISLFSLMFFFTLSVLLLTKNLTKFDENLLIQIHQILPSWFVYIAKAFYFLGEAEVAVFIVLFSLGFFAWKKHWSEAQTIATSSVIVLLLVWVLKPLFDRARPLERLVENINGRSFPSGHASGNILLYLLLAYIISIQFPKLKIPLYLTAIIIIFLMGLGSVYLRVHWVTDILGGYCIGYILFTISLGFLRISSQKY